MLKYISIVVIHLSPDVIWHFMLYIVLQTDFVLGCYHHLSYKQTTCFSFSVQVHRGEYGVHWNFFFTLAAVSILTSIINIQPQYSGILGVAILIGTIFAWCTL